MVKTPPLSWRSLPAWKDVIRSMIREQMPNFHEDPVWANQRNTAKMSGRGSKGVVQSRILEDICDALESLVPKDPVADSRNSGAEAREPGAVK